ncbi:MAG: hypothetical protein IKE70_02600 [Bacilli bacterium]|nr:hypothetical protein [Bacilli bacterium]
MKEKLIELRNTIERYIEQSDESIIKTEYKKDNLEEVTVREKEISITKIDTKESSEYYILDKRIVPTFVTIDNLDYKNSNIQITIADEVQKIRIGDVSTSKTLFHYFDELNNWLIENLKESKKQVK